MKHEPGIVRVLTKVENAVFLVEKTASIILLILMTLVTVIQVALRKFFEISILVGIDELINWTFVWLVFIGIGMMVRQGGHIGLEFFYCKLPFALRKAGTILIDALLIAMAAIIFKNSLPFLASQMNILTTSANIPKAYLYASVPVGMALLTFHLLVKIIKTCCSSWVETP